MSLSNLAPVIVLAAGLGLGHWLAWQITVQTPTRASLHPARWNALNRAVPAVLMVAALIGLALHVQAADGQAPVDAAVDSFLNPVRYEALIALFEWITLVGNTGSLIAIAALAAIVLWGIGRRRDAALVLTVWLGAYATTWALKHLIDRPRPDFAFDVVAHSPSFPSGHATGSLALFGVLAYVAARRTARFRWRFEIVFWAAVLIALVSVSRIYLSVHHASDVFAGFLVGGVWLYGAIAAGRTGGRTGEKVRPPRP